MSGPVIGSNNAGTAWGSAVGTLVTWEPFDFGLRRAGVLAAEAARAESEATQRWTEYRSRGGNGGRLPHASRGAGDGAGRAGGGGARANGGCEAFRRWCRRTFGPARKHRGRKRRWRPRERRRFRREQAVEVARATLSQFLGTEPAQTAIAAPGLARLPVEQRDTALSILRRNPLLACRTRPSSRPARELHALERTYFPRFYLQGAAYARGSGAETERKNAGRAQRPGAEHTELRSGFQRYVPGFRFQPRCGPGKHAQAATVRAQQARSQQIATELRARWNVAIAGLERRPAGWRQIRRCRSPPRAPRRSRRRRDTRRDWATIDEVAEAQRLLTQAEIDDALARLGVWRGLLGVAAAAGDIRPFLAEVSRR